MTFSRFDRKGTQRDNKHHRGEKTSRDGHPEPPEGGFAAHAGGAPWGAGNGQEAIMALQTEKIALEELPFFAAPKPRVFGHRGAAGIAPENTLVSFRKALEEGAGYIELDVHESRDGEIVVIHDDTVDRTTDGAGQVGELSTGALRRLDAGYRFTIDGGRSYPYRGRGVRIPTLQEFFESCPGVPTVIEVKVLGIAGIETLLHRIEAAGMASRVLLASYEDGVMAALRKAIVTRSPAIATSHSFGEIRALLDWLWKGRRGEAPIRGQALQIPCEYEGLPLVTESSVELAHSMGLEVHVWTINEKSEMRRLLDLGVDGIVTDFPARMHELAREKG